MRADTRAIQINEADGEAVAILAVATATADGLRKVAAALMDEGVYTRIVKSFLLHLVLTAVAILIVANVVGGVYVGGFGTALIGALILGVVNGVVRPLMILLTLPLTILTLGLFLFVVNALMFWLVAALVPGFQISGFGAALLGSLLLTVLNVLIDRLTPKD